jgi:hypothetical protein
VAMQAYSQACPVWVYTQSNITGILCHRQHRFIYCVDSQRFT